MANTSRANGLRPVQDLNGSAWCGKVGVYAVAAGVPLIGIGSIVQLAGSANADGVPTVTRVAGNLIDGVSNGGASSPVGVVVGFNVQPTALDLPTHSNSVARLVYVVDDPNAMFEVQEDSAGGALALASVGLNADLLAGTVSTTTGRDSVEVDTSTVGTGASLPVKILSFSRRVDNETSSSYAKVIVKFNSHYYGHVSTGI